MKTLTLLAFVLSFDADHADQQSQGRVSGLRIRGLNSTQYDNKELPKIEFEKISVTANINVKFIVK